MKPVAKSLAISQGRDLLQERAGARRDPRKVPRLDGLGAGPPVPPPASVVQPPSPRQCPSFRMVLLVPVTQSLNSAVNA